MGTPEAPSPQSISAARAKTLAPMKLKDPEPIRKDVPVLPESWEYESLGNCYFHVPHGVHTEGPDNVRGWPKVTVPLSTFRPRPQEHFKKGDSVVIRGLQSEQGKTLNGHTGTVGEWLLDSERWGVTLKDGRDHAVKPTNMELTEDTKVRRSPLRELKGIPNKWAQQKELLLPLGWVKQVAPVSGRTFYGNSYDPRNLDGDGNLKDQKEWVTQWEYPDKVNKLGYHYPTKSSGPKEGKHKGFMSHTPEYQTKDIQRRRQETLLLDEPGTLRRLAEYETHDFLITVPLFLLAFFVFDRIYRRFQKRD